MRPPHKLDRRRCQLARTNWLSLLAGGDPGDVCGRREPDDDLLILSFYHDQCERRTRTRARMSTVEQELLISLHLRITKALRAKAEHARLESRRRASSAQTLLE